MTYNDFIENILNTRGRFACGEEYHERHHIIPKCLGGTNDKDNLIDLYAKEHFIAHKLLALENPNNSKLIWAWWGMTNLKDKSQQERYNVTPEEYEEARKEFTKTMSLNFSGKNNWNYGRKMSEEAKRKMSEAKKGKYLGPDNPHYGKKHSAEARQKISEFRKSYTGWHHSEETRHKMSEKAKGENNGMYGKKHTEEAKKKISEKFSIPVYQYDLDMNFIKKWRSASEAARYYNFASTNITKVCKHKAKTTHGYIWRYESEVMADDVE